MSKYKQIINSLSELENQHNPNFDPSVNFLSIYLQVGSKTRDRVKTELRSQIDKGFKQRVELIENSTIEREVYDKLSDVVDKLEKMPKGMAIFAVLDDSVENHALEIYALDDKPIADFHIGSTFRTFNLTMLDLYSPKVLVVMLDSERARICRFLDKQLEELAEIETPFTLSTDQNLSQHTANSAGASTGGAVFPTGEHPNELRELHKKFLQLVWEKLDEMGLQQGVTDADGDGRRIYDRIVVLYSTSYRDAKDYIYERVKKYVKAPPMMIAHENLSDPNIAQELEQAICDQIDAEVAAEWEASKENFHHYAEDVAGVSKMLREGRVKTLYFKPELAVPGTIEQVMPEAANMAISRNVDNLVPWMVRAARKQSAIIYVLHPDKYENAPDLAAEARY